MTCVPANSTQSDAGLPNIPSMPQLQPFFAQAEADIVEEGGAGGQLAVVPPAKLLIIEDVTVNLGITHGAAMTFFIEVFWLGGPEGTVGVRYYPIPLIQRHTASDNDWLVGGRRVRWYIEQGAQVCYLAEGEIHSGTTGGLSVTVSGRFVDVMANRPFTNLIRSFRSPFHSAEEPFWG